MTAHKVFKIPVSDDDDSTGALFDGSCEFLPARLKQWLREADVLIWDE